MFQKLEFGPGYCQSGCLEFLFMANLGFTVFIYILAKVTNNYSWMDRFWMILPLFYSTHYMLHPYLCDKDHISGRKILMSGLIFFWGLRLIWHFFRKGLYSSGGEDHRWTYMKARRPAWKMELTLILFISLYQPMLSAWLTGPVYYTTQKSLGVKDFIVTGVAVFFLVMELVADNQMFNYHTQKKMWSNLKGSKQQMPEKFKRGFVAEGLFRYSRHPNYFAQMGFWWCIYAFSVLDYGFNLTGLAALQLTIFFQQSVAVTEKISSQKYPKFKEYQKGVSKLIPLPSSFQEEKSD